jgi:hypothetical protein
MNDGLVVPVVRLVTFLDVDDSAGPRQLSVSARHEVERGDGRRVLLPEDRGRIAADASELERSPHDVVLSERLLGRLGREPRP